ncbi:hypothetical protein LCGC14_0225270 [marine sediment metagenome]|uniref:Transcription regulator TrmB N-terminal domain-containing protein n=1 Tax=marine sediment metagenome TaxID=412755 RepID=A0A0F9XG96_9ZZZZ
MKDKFKRLTYIQNEIIELLWRNNIYSRSTFVSELETPRTTIYDNLKKLLERDILIKETLYNEKRGRPHVLWSLTREYVNDVEGG